MQSKQTILYAKKAYSQMRNVWFNVNHLWNVVRQRGKILQLIGFVLAGFTTANTVIPRLPQI
jgi:hypothetical protein